MPIVKTATGYYSKDSLLVISIMLFWFLVTAIIINMFGDATIVKVVLGFWFVGLVVVLYWYAFKVSKKGFACPDCNIVIYTHIETSGKAGEPIMYHCEKCDVLWHTGNVQSG